VTLMSPFALCSVPAILAVSLDCYRLLAPYAHLLAISTYNTCTAREGQACDYASLTPLPAGA